MTTYHPMISDLQIPLQDKRAVEAVKALVNDLDVDTACVGDEGDFWQIGRWCRGRYGEFDGQLGKHRDDTIQTLLDLRVKHLARSNHGLSRLEGYLESNAPALANLPELQYEQWMRLTENGIAFHRNPYQIFPNTYLIHGDEGGGSLSQEGGKSAANKARYVRANIIMGHTHRGGVQFTHAAIGGKVISRLWGLECGHLMDERKATYLKGGIGNWNKGVGMIVVDGRDIIPMFLPITNGRLFFNGTTYKG